jgi:hypothetical protein
MFSYEYGQLLPLPMRSFICAFSSFVLNIAKYFELCTNIIYEGYSENNLRLF